MLNIVKYKTSSGGWCKTHCPVKSWMVGSTACQECDNNISFSKAFKYVRCKAFYDNNDKSK